MNRAKNTKGRIGMRPCSNWMSFFTVSLLLAVLGSATNRAKCDTITVRADGTGDYQTIQAAIDDANEGDEVVLEPGTYTGTGNRDIDFLGKAITVRSTDPNDPNIVATTIIDCNGTHSNQRRGFKFHSDEGPDSVLSGLTITNGFAARERLEPDYWYEPHTYAYAGGAIFCKCSNPTIANCRITGNRAYDDGGGICFSYCSSPTITNCIITANNNGGVYLYHCNEPNISACTISNNSGTGIYCRQCNNATITDCNILGNTNLGIHGGVTTTVSVSNCNISNNSGGIYDAYNATITNSIINNNSNAGGIYSRGSLTITNSIISNNSGGGGIYTGSATITGCAITGNSSGGDGGGIYCGDSTTIKNCTITGNSARFGGGIYCSGNTTITNCIINGNSAEYVGAIFCFWNATITNCDISGNSAKGIGGIYCYGEDFTVANCTITANIGEEDFGGGICCSDAENMTINNCILRDNESPEGHEMYLAGYGNTSVSYTDILGGPNDIYVEPGVTLNWGLGNIDKDPCFIQPGYWADVNDPNIIVEPNDPNAVWVGGDYHLLPASLCIDTGDPNYIPGPNETDLDGNPRVIGDAIDMGAYEYFDTPPVACIVGGDRTVEVGIGCEARVTLDGSCSEDSDSTPGTNDDIVYFDWYEGDTLLGSGEIIDCNLPLGEHVIVLEVTDKAGAFDTNEVTITIEDTTPPEFTLSVTPDVLWPPNHKMVLITPSWMVSDNCDESPDVSLVSITMNEDDDAKGDGHTTADIQIDPDGIWLRAERSGKGNSRIYAITYQAVDDSGNVTLASVTVTVP